jgi:hypothetical protein
MTQKQGSPLRRQPQYMDTFTNMGRCRSLLPVGVLPQTAGKYADVVLSYSGVKAAATAAAAAVTAVAPSPVAQLALSATAPVGGVGLGRMARTRSAAVLSATQAMATGGGAGDTAAQTQTQTQALARRPSQSRRVEVRRQPMVSESSRPNSSSRQAAADLKAVVEVRLLGSCVAWLCVCVCVCVCVIVVQGTRGNPGCACILVCFMQAASRVARNAGLGNAGSVTSKFGVDSGLQPGTMSGQKALEILRGGRGPATSPVGGAWLADLVSVTVRGAFVCLVFRRWCLQPCFRRCCSGSRVCCGGVASPRLLLLCPRNDVLLVGMLLLQRPRCVRRARRGWTSTRLQSPLHSRRTRESWRECCL